MKARATRQLTAIYDALAASSDHPTADQVFQRVRDTLPRISLGTVYRNLEKLRDQGRLRVVRLGNGQAHYDAMVDAHDHFVCERCGQVLDLPGAEPAAVLAALDRQGHVVRWHTTSLFGLCAACRHPAAPPSDAGRRAEAG